MRKKRHNIFSSVPKRLPRSLKTREPQASAGGGMGHVTEMNVGGWIPDDHWCFRGLGSWNRAGSNSM